MKFINKLSLFIALFIFFNIYITVAIAGNIGHNYFFERGTDVPLDNVTAFVYLCQDNDCREVDMSIPHGRFEENSGNTNHITIEYLGIGNRENPARYAQYFYRQGYLPLENTASDWGTGGEFTVNRKLGKLNYCTSNIDNFYVINEVRPNEPLQIDVQASLGADTYSAFMRPDRAPYYIPGDQNIRDEFYSAETELNLKIINSENEVVFEDNKLLNIYLDEKESVQYTWIPTVSGRYRAQLTSTVIDDQCIPENDIPQQVSKEFKVLEDQDDSMCYTLLNRMTFNNPHPVENDNIKIYFEKISNFRDLNQILHPVSTFTKLSVYKENQLVHEESKIFGPNGNPVDPTRQEFSWIPDSSGLYNIVIDGVAKDEQCNNIENLEEHLETNLVVSKVENPEFNLEIQPINDLSTKENEQVQFTVKVDYDGNRDLIFNVENLPRGASFGDNTFTWTPDYETVSHNTIIGQLINIFGIELKKDFELEFKVTDGILRDSEKVKITVIDKNREPQISNVRDIEITEGDSVNANKIFKFKDDDNDTLRITYTAPLNNKGEWKTEIGDAGIYNVLVRVEDNFNGNDKETFKVIVKELNQNRAPVLEDINDKTVKEGDSVIFTINANDMDNDILFYSADIDPNAIGASFNEETRTFTWHTRKGQKGIYEMEFIVTDGLQEDSKRMKIFVVEEETQVLLGDSESHKFSVYSLVVEDETIKPGNNLEIFARVRNYGTVDDKITLRLEIRELGIRETKTFTVDEKSGKLKIFSIKIPNDSPKGNYIIEAIAFNNNWHSIRHAEFSIV